MQAKDMIYTLQLRVPMGTDRSEFEPDAVWSESNGWLLVTQSVGKDGGMLEGRTGTFFESLSEIVSDPVRFVALSVKLQMVAHKIF